MTFVRHTILQVVTIFFTILILGPLAVVDNTTTAQDLSQGPGTNIGARIKDLSDQIYKTMLVEGTKRVAVLPFVTPQTDGDSITYHITLLGWHIADKLANSLFEHGDKFAVVDRTHVEQVLRELKLNQTGIIDQSTAKQLGHLLGADAIVAGTVTDLVTSVDATARVIETEQGKVLAIASTEFAMDKAVSMLFGRGGASIDQSGIIPVANRDDLLADGKTIRYRLDETFLTSGKFVAGQWELSRDFSPAGEMTTVVSQLSQNPSSFLFGSEGWYNYSFEVKVKLTAGPYFVLFLRATDTKHCYQWHFNYENPTGYPAFYALHYINGDISDVIWRQHDSPPLGQWMKLKVVCNGNNIKLYKDGSLYQEITHAGHCCGMVGLGSTGGTRFTFCDPVITLGP